MFRNGYRRSGLHFCYYGVCWHNCDRKRGRTFISATVGSHGDKGDEDQETFLHVDSITEPEEKPFFSLAWDVELAGLEVLDHFEAREVAGRWQILESEPLPLGNLVGLHDARLTLPLMSD